MCLYYPEVKGGGEATVIILCTSYNLASFPGSRAGEEEREPGTHCLHMRQVPLVTCMHTTRYTKLRSILFTCWKAALCGYTPSETHTGSLYVKSNIASTVTVWITSSEVIGELQRRTLRQSHAAVFSWNPRTCGQFLQAKSWVPLSLNHCPHGAWSVTGIFYTGEFGIPCGGLV